MTKNQNSHLEEDFSELESLLLDRSVWEPIIDRDMQAFLSIRVDESNMPSPEERRGFEQILQECFGIAKPLAQEAEEV